MNWTIAIVINNESQTDDTPSETNRVLSELQSFN